MSGGNWGGYFWERGFVRCEVEVEVEVEDSARVFNCKFCTYGELGGNS